MTLWSDELHIPNSRYLLLETRVQATISLGEGNACDDHCWRRAAGSSLHRLCRDLQQQPAKGCRTLPDAQTESFANSCTVMRITDSKGMRASASPI